MHKPICRTYRAACIAVLALAPSLSAQTHSEADSSWRLNRYGHDLVYGTALGLVYAGVDQYRNNPPEWGSGGSGFGKRAASDIGEFVVQETTTDLLAAALNRPLDYKRCGCSDVGSRLAWVAQSSVTDPMPDGSHALAVPRIVGAFAGSFAQAAWRPRTSSVVSTGLVNGALSLVIGAGINLFYEFRPHW